MFGSDWWDGIPGIGCVPSTTCAFHFVGLQEAIKAVKGPYLCVCVGRSEGFFKMNDKSLRKELAKLHDLVCELQSEVDSFKTRVKFSTKRGSFVLRWKVFFAWYDIWVGVYVDRDAKAVYVCPLPCVVFKFWRYDTCP